ncbi:MULTISPECIES: HNH endonuclease signature motif containing protein [Brevibacillus]|uniref:HNH endonuclease signature motif containing protein n=1 Tax=Brevibacillus TaxID=55080 RepID=UPI000EC49810|nr:HNH endonuclease domain-containing protein [Brevibacillus sp.]HBZ79858.1 hypothetical protein [Brevibacillus sp.]
MRKSMASVVTALSLLSLLFSPAGSYAKDTTEKKSDAIAKIEERIASGELKKASSIVFEITSDSSSNEVLSIEEIETKQSEVLEEVEQELKSNLGELSEKRQLEWTNAIKAGKNPYKVVGEVKSSHKINAAAKINKVRVESGYLMDSRNAELIIYAEIEDIDGTSPALVSGTATLQYADKRNAKYKDEDDLKFTFKAGRDLYEGSRKFSDPISVQYTHFWRNICSTVATWSDGTSMPDYDVGTAYLLNKKAIEYPVYEDDNSGIVMFEPERADLPWVPNNQREPRDNNMRSKYVKWYENRHGSPDFNWNDVDIHHIIPLSYGGDNSYNNLIPLPEDFHDDEVTPWWRNYGKYVPQGDDY